MKTKTSKKSIKAVSKPKYVDPLHIPSDRLVVKYNGEEVFLLNKSLLDRQNCWDNLESIKATHVRKLQVYESIDKENDKETLKKLALKLTEIEFELQELWGFPLDSNFHRFWECPKCTCPSLDNRDRYPHGCIIDSSCPLHGN